MALATAIGSFPGSSPEAYAQWVRIVLDELDLPLVPELPARGAIATMTGRALALVADLGVDLQPAGWRLTGGGSGIDHRRARSLVAQDLDTVEELAHGYTGAFKIQVCGPWTLAATVERPRGDKVLADFGARRDLAQALAEGVRDHIADVRRRLDGVDRLVVQVDEPALAAVLGARIPTASGFGKHRSVDPADASATLSWVLDAISESGAEPWVHSCADDPALTLVRGAGARGLAVDVAQLSASALDDLAEAAEAGTTVAFGVVPATDPATWPTDKDVVAAVSRPLDLLGLDPAELKDGLVVSPTCGLAGASDAWARRAVELSAAAAQRL